MKSEYNSNMIDLKQRKSIIKDFKTLIPEETKNESHKDSVDITCSNTSRSTISDAMLPFYKKEVPYSISMYTIISLYTKSCEKYKFLITEQTPSACTAYHSQRFSIKTIISCCLGKKTKPKLSSTRLIISADPHSHYRIILLKGLHGDYKLVKSLINHFTQLIEHEVLTNENRKYLQVVDEEELVLTCKNESYSYYQFYKILSCEAYTLGKSVAEFCNSFTSQYRNPIESSQLLPQPLYSIQAIVESTIEALFSHFNYGKKNTEKVMVYCRSAVEKFIYSKLNLHLIEIYKAKYQNDDEVLLGKKKEIENMDSNSVLKSLGVNENFWLSDERLPYQEAIEHLGKINDCVTPAEKLNCLMSFEAAMKSSVVQYWKGQIELDYDNSLLVTMFVILKASFYYPKAEISLICDYLADKSEEEKTLVISIEKAIIYLINN